MSYNQIDLAKYNFDSTFVEYINSYLDIYKNKVLQDAPAPLEVQNTTSEKRDIKAILEDFFFSPKYDNVLDAIGFGTKKAVEG
ncbi:hypothetical protein [Tenacibaculum insulae]|uniref:hypothetical protein n=1 Tax=Tenacibaculum insulae TaxID=2029677 RepID=UPI003AB714A3